MINFVGISSIEEEEVSDVYDITVENTHNFFANGICVHNCISGPFAYDMMSQFRDYSFDDMNFSVADNNPQAYEAGMREMMNTLDKLSDAVGRDNVFAELQFHKLAPQSLVNRAIIDLHKRTGVQLTATADSHYPDPKMWQAREIYKLLGRMKYDTFSPDKLPKSVEELKCQLYPKNAEQMWASYLENKKPEMCFYEDDIVSKAIENSWHIAHDVIGDVKVDNSLCLPSFIVSKDKTDMQALMEACKVGMIERGLADKKEYIDRLKTELLVIKEKKFARYFLMMKRIIDIAHKNLMVGPGRGSGSGSLVNYVLDITDIDPIKYGLYFERFLNRARCLDPSTLVKTSLGVKCMSELSIGDKLEGTDGFTTVINIQKQIHDKFVKLTINGQQIICSLNHKWVIKRENLIMTVETRYLRKTDEIKIE